MSKHVTEQLGKTLFTSTQAAHISYLSVTKILRLLDSGLLKGYRIPGSRHRRITRNQLKQFLDAFGLPMDRLPPET